MTLLDVRDEWETKLARLEHAAHIPVVEIEHRLDELDPADEIIVYCHHGIRSAAVADFLRQAGFPKAVNLTGGLDLWARQSIPRCAATRAMKGHLQVSRSETRPGSGSMPRPEFVRVTSVRSGCAWVILDRPPLNLIVPEMIAGLKAAFQMLARDSSVRAAIVTGAGRAMTAGMQLQFLLGLPADGARAFITSLHEAIEAVHEAPFPTVAMVNGACLGAGFELAMACDLRDGGRGGAPRAARGPGRDPLRDRGRAAARADRARPGRRDLCSPATASQRRRRSRGAW